MPPTSRGLVEAALAPGSPAESSVRRAPTGTRLAVLLPTLYSVRNVVHSSVLGGLHSGGVEVSLLLRDSPPESRRRVVMAASIARMEPLQAVNGTEIAGRALLNSVIASAFARRNRLRSYELYRLWFQRDATRRERRRRRFVDGLGALAATGPAFRGARALAERLYRRSRDLGPIRAQLKELRPTALWSTTCTSPFEYPYFLAARDLGIPVIASILSFDNLTSRSAVPTCDHYFVWSEAMKAQLLQLYPEVSADRVSVTGTAQFDFHRKPSRWSRAETLQRLGLPPGSRYFLYAASHVSLAPEEPRLVHQLARRMASTDDLSTFHILLRLHPQDDGSRWGQAANDPRVVVSLACEDTPGGDEWKLPTPEEQDRLIASLTHAEACLNVASTMSLDAAVLDRPALGIDLSSEPNGPAGVMYSEYGATHYEPLVRSGGVEVARGWDELIGLMRLAATEPGRRRAERARMVEQVCGRVDGRAGERIAATLIGLLRDRLSSGAAR